MCFEILDGVADFAKGVLACIACVFCSGPICIIIGISLLVSENTRDSDVSAYNAAVADYRGTFTQLQRTDVSVNGADLGRTRQSVPVAGNTEGVVDSEHIVFSGTVAMEASNSYTFTATGGTTGTFTATIPRSASVSRTLRCTRDQCDRDCSFSDYECTQDSMRRYCQNTLNGRYTQTNSDYECDDGEVCGRCEYTGYLERACVVANFASSNVARSSRYTSCEYPFDSFSYGAQSSSNSFNLRLVAESDPYIELQRLTEGSNDFGVTEEQQRSTGIVLLVLGILITLAMGCAGFFFYRRQKAKREEQQPQQAPVVHVVQDGHPQHGGHHHNNGMQGHGHHQQPLHHEPHYGQQPHYAQQGQPDPYYAQQPPQQHHHHNQQPPPQPLGYGQAPPPPQQHGNTPNYPHKY